MNILTLDTSTPLATIALSVNGKTAAESSFNTDRSLSARLIPGIEHLLKLAGISVPDIDLYAASTGPGSFTGVRGGVATVQGLALAGGKPCVGFSSLTLLAMNFSLSTTRVCTLLDARKSEVYAALFDCTSIVPAAVIPDCVMPPERLLELLAPTTASPVIFCGDGAVRYHDLIADLMGGQAIFAPFPLNAPRASNAAVLAMEAFQNNAALEPFQLLPTYLRASEAEINRTAKL